MSVKERDAQQHTLDICCNWHSNKRRKPNEPEASATEKRSVADASGSFRARLGLLRNAKLRLGLGAERFQLLDMSGIETLLRLGPLHRPIEAVLRFRGIADLGVAHGQ